MIQAPERSHRDAPVLQCTASQAKRSAAAIHIAHERAASTPSLVCTGRPPPARAADRPSRLRRVSPTCPASQQRHRSNPARLQANRRIPTEQRVETQSNLKQHSSPTGPTSKMTPPSSQAGIPCPHFLNHAATDRRVAPCCWRRAASGSASTPTTPTVLTRLSAIAAASRDDAHQGSIAASHSVASPPQTAQQRH